jgi:hypothetical protein
LGLARSKSGQPIGDIHTEVGRIYLEGIFISMALPTKGQKPLRQLNGAAETPASA